MFSVSLCLAVLDTEEERVAFELFYDKYKRFVWQEAQKIVKTKEPTEDVSQEVFLYIAKNFQKMQRYDHRQILRYLELCTRGRALNYIRDNKEEWIECDADVVEKAVDELDAEKVVLNQETVLQMHQVIAELADRYRLPLELRMMDIPPAEIAKTLNLSPTTVYKQIERGCTIIRERMVQENG